MKKDLKKFRVAITKDGSTLFFDFESLHLCRRFVNDFCGNLLLNDFQFKRSKCVFDVCHEFISGYCVFFL